MFEGMLPHTSPRRLRPLPSNTKRYYPGRYWVLALGFFTLSAILSSLLSVGHWDKTFQIPIMVLTAFLYSVSAICLYLAADATRKHYRDRSILNEIFEGSTSARLVTDIQDRTLFYNTAFEDLATDCGEPGLNVLRAIFARDADKDAQERLEVLIDNAMRGHEDQIELPLRSPVDHSERWLRVSAQPVAGWLGTIHWRIDDITERRSIETVIREEREKLVDFTDHAPVGFYATDEMGRFTFVNATLARWLGTDIGSLLNGGTLHAYLVKPPLNGHPYDVYEGGGVRQVGEVKMKGPSGRIFAASVNQSVVHETDEKVRVRGVVHDLTTEREMRQALRDSEDRFQRFFEEAPLGIALVDTDGIITDANEALGAMISVESDSINGRKFNDIIDDEDRLSVAEKLSHIEEGESMLTPLEVRLKSAEEGKSVTVHMHARKFKGRNIAVHFIDRTEQKVLEEQFTQSQKMQAVGQLAGGVAHDFNNLLTAMIGFCDLLLLRHKPGDPSFNDIMQIKQNSNRAANLVRQLLAFSRQQQLQPKVLDITETLTELSHLIRRLIGVQIELDMIHAPSLDPVKVDEGQLEQVLINLAVNARDAMNGKGNLSIETENLYTDKPQDVGTETMPAGHWVVIHVRDTGCGIDPRTMERIFEPFFTTKEIGAGTGLGLATVYGIVRQTGGYIGVDSIVGEGTTFSIYLPRFDAKEDGKPVKAVTKQSGNEDLTGTATILLVEDEDAVRMFSSRALANKGYHVLDAASGEAALEVLENHDGKIDLMVTDVIMPEMDGPTLAKKVLEKHPGLPVIFVSGYTEDRFKDQIGDNAYFLPKPFTLQQLAEKVKEILAKK